MPTSVALGRHFEDFVRDQIRHGRFNDVSEVVRAGLRLLEEQEQRRLLELESLRQAIVAGRDSGPTLDAEAVFDRLEARYAAQARG